MPTSNRPTGGGEPAGSSGEVQYNNAGAFGGITGSSWDGAGKLSLLTGAGVKWLNVGDATNAATASTTVNQVLQFGNGLSATSAAAGLDNVTQIGASITLTLTDAGSAADGTFIGQHIAITDENGPQQYGLAIAGGGADINVLGGKNWTVIAAGAENNDIDYLENGLVIGQDIDVVNVDNLRSGVALIGHDITVTNATSAYAFGMSSVTITDVPASAGAFGAMALGGSSAIDGDDTFDTLFTLGYGHSLTATANQQMLIGFDGTTLPASEAVGIGVSATPELVLTAGFASVTAALKVAMQTPASAGAAGTKDTFAFDTGFLYVCTATNTWKRVAIATW